MSLLLAAAAIACAPIVALEAEVPLRTELEQALAGRGVEIRSGHPSCPVVHVEAKRAAAGIEVARIDGAGRWERRSAREKRLAAALIESWARGDLEEDLLALPPPPAAAAPDAEAPDVEAPEMAGREDEASEEAGPEVATLREPAPDPARGPAAAAERERMPTPEPRQRLLLGAMLELGSNDEGATESGGAIRIGWAGGLLQPELALRYASGGLQATADLTATEHWLAEVLAGLRLPLRAGALTFAPGVALGLGIDTVERSGCRDCGRLVADDAHRTGLALRSEASLLAALRLWGGLGLEAGIAASLDLLADTSAWRPGYAGEADAFALQAPPSGRLRVGLGLVWSAW